MNYFKRLIWKQSLTVILGDVSTLKTQEVVHSGLTPWQHSQSWFLFADEVEGKCHPALGQKALPALPEPFWWACVCQIPKWRACAHPLCCQQTHDSQLTQSWHPDLKSSAPECQGNSKFFLQPAGLKEQTASMLCRSQNQGKASGCWETPVPVNQDTSLLIAFCVNVNWKFQK
jgi:hypothetical protein